MRKILFAAAHGGYSIERVAFGGGGMVAHLFDAYWRNQKALSYEMLHPGLMGSLAPQNDEIIRYSTTQYARFCQRFESVLTSTISQASPSEVSILCNDISEGPSFQMLAEKGYSLFTIFHVDVVDYVARVYGRGILPTYALTRGYAHLKQTGLHRLFPSILKLIFEKQDQCVRYSKGLIVPSPSMKDVLITSYPQMDPAKVHVIPWGCFQQVKENTQDKKDLRMRYGISPQATVLLTLSRISPEKAQDRLLKSLRQWESKSSYPKEGVELIICGAPAYMHGEAFHRNLKRLASRLFRTKVHFVGYVFGEQKADFFSLADLYVFPSRHESYGLTLLEAMGAGLPALTTTHHGSSGLDSTSGVWVVPPGPESQIIAELADAMAHLVSNPLELATRASLGKAYAARQHFDAAAEQVQALLLAQ